MRADFMRADLKNTNRILLGCSVALAMSVSIGCARAMGAEKVLYSFKGGSDGLDPQAGVIADENGNLYGTTAGGGGGTKCRDGDEGCGIVFALATDGTETVLHTFAGGCDGAFPFAGLIADKAGNDYGTTTGGGICNSSVGFGTVFKITPDGAGSVVYAFQGGSAGEFPTGGVIADEKGNLYGAIGGGDPAGCSEGCGFVFEITTKSKMRVVYNFQGGSDGDSPYGALLMDKMGNIYGTTLGGGGTSCDDGFGCGTVFKITPGGAETVLYAFQGGSDGWRPETGVIADSAGNLYGTTTAGGSGSQGTVFKVTSDGAESVLYAFQDGKGGIEPQAGVIMDKAGNLYGTTYAGGTGCHTVGCGVVFKLAPDGTETVLYAFANRHGASPAAGLLMGKHGDLYGTATVGGKDKDGVVFRVKD